MARPDTKQVLLDTAERLFAENGFSEVSLRQIITASRANLAAVHYHFGSRAGLIRAILERRIGPLTRERLDLLTAAERKAGRKGPSLPALLDAFLAPPLRLSRDPKRGGDIFMRLIGRVLSDPSRQFQEMLLEQFREVVDRFVPAFHRALPHLPMPELVWRLHFTAGAMIHTMTHGDQLQRMCGAAGRLGGVDETLARLIAFAAAGLQAPTRKERRRAE